MEVRGDKGEIIGIRRICGDIIYSIKINGMVYEIYEDSISDPNKALFTEEELYKCEKYRNSILKTMCSEQYCELYYKCKRR